MGKPGEHLELHACFLLMRLLPMLLQFVVASLNLTMTMAFSVVSQLTVALCALHSAALD